MGQDFRKFSRVPMKEVMAALVVRLRYEATCIHCARPVAAGKTAWWDSTAQWVECFECRPPEPLGAWSADEAGRREQRAGLGSM
jgi:hypothetical protein